MTLDQVVSRARSMPLGVWVGAGAAVLVWMTRPRPSSVRDGQRVLGSEDIQVMSPAGAYNPIGAHAAGLPYELGHLCPIQWSGRTRAYPAGAGAVATAAAPGPADQDGSARAEYGPQRGRC